MTIYHHQFQVVQYLQDLGNCNDLPEYPEHVLAPPEADKEWSNK